jgi:hypothetical protein
MNFSVCIERERATDNSPAWEKCLKDIKINGQWVSASQNYEIAKD